MNPNSWLNSATGDSDSAFSFSREKANFFTWRTLYLVKRFLVSLFGKVRITKFLLMINWYTNRLAFESAQELFTEHKNVSVIGATKEFLQQSITPGAKVLDLGCSSGHWSFLAADLGAQVIGIDLNSHAIELAKSKNSSVVFRHISVEEFLSEDEDIYDVAILTHIVEHLDLPQAILSLLKNRVKTLILEVPDVESSALNFARLKLGLPFYTDPDHVREYSLETLQGLLAMSGWEVKQCIQRGGTIAVLVVHCEN
jgi:SAM-dependent methyltransferase